MAKLIDLVAVRLDPELDLLVLEAPWCSPIKDGMTVLCETSQGEEMGIVEAVIHAVNADEETLNLVKLLAKMPKHEKLGRVISYFEEKDLDYDD